MKNLLLVVCLSMVGLLNAQSKKEQIEILTNRVDSLNQVVSSQSKTINDKNSQINGLNSKITSLESNISLLNNNVSKLTSELQQSKTESATKTQDLAKLQTQLKTKTDSLALVLGELDKLKPAPKPVVTNNNTGKVTQTGPYKSVKIGTQTWMAENLNVATFRNGDSIPQAKTNEEWEKAGENQQPAWCYYNNDPANGEKYGKLYNWYAVNDKRGLAPVGFHIPSDAEWTKLTDFLGGEGVAGTKMKNTSGWAQNGNGTNESGFSGLPGGGRGANGAFGVVGLGGGWWSSTENGVGSAWDRYLYYNDGSGAGSTTMGEVGSLSVASGIEFTCLTTGRFDSFDNLTI
ncbi:MAG: hypothetical protein FJX80_08895 [Bacteroidetes bacterium]|nr:hypothetical protein [Bacteroidota bacterium]